MTRWFISFFGSTPVPYFAVGLAVLFVFLALAASRESAFTERLGFEVAFLLAAGLTLFAWRWPAFLWQHPMNPDEGLWIAAAIKATVDWVPWRGFDLGTSGPLSAYILALPAAFGQQIDFFSTRLLGTGLLTGAIAGLYHTVKWLNGPCVARLAIVPFVMLLALTKDWNFLHFSSEIVPVFLTTTALAASAYLVRQGRTRWRRRAAIALAGLCIGSTCFAKLQALPLALLLLAFVIVGIFWANRHRWNDILTEALLFILSVCAVPAAIIVTLWNTDEWQYAMQVSLRNSVRYVGGVQHRPLPLSFPFNVSNSYTAFVIPCLAVIFFAAAALLFKRKSVYWRSLSFDSASLLFLIAAAFAIYTPRRPFAHYLLFSVVPLSWCLATLLVLTRRAGLWIKRDRLMSISYVALFTIPALAVTMSSAPSSYISKISFNSTWVGSNAAIAIARHVRPGGRMAIWGAAPHFYVQTQTVMASRYAQLMPCPPGKARDFYYPRYVRDLEASTPEIFVDAVSPGAFFHKDRATKGYQTFPALASLVEQRFVLAEEVEGVRIFVRKDLQGSSAAVPGRANQ